jgi:hypothetical protein
MVGAPFAHTWCAHGGCSGKRVAAELGTNVLARETREVP